MFTIRHVLGWGLLLLTSTPVFVQSPVFAQSVDDSVLRFRPFHDVVVVSFDNVWQEHDPDLGIESPISEVALPPVELASFRKTATTVEGAMTTTTSGVDLPRLLPISTAHFATQVPQPLATHELMQSHETGLREWFVGMLGFVGLVALGGVYWIYYVRPALDVRHTTGRLRLSSALSLPRRSGLVLVDVEDQTVLVAMDSGGIRQVVPLGLWPGMKTTRRRAAADKAQLASSPSPSEGTQAPEELAFHDVYQDRLALGGAVRAVPSTARPEAALQTADAHSHKAA